MNYSEKDKIIFFTENYERGGGNRYLYDLVCLAQIKNQHITVLSNQFALDSVEEKWFSDLNVKRHSLTILSWGELRARFNLRRNFFLKLFARFIFLILSPLVRIYQFLLFISQLKKENPALIVAANGGYPAGGAVNRFALAAAILRIPVYYSVVNIPSTHWWDKSRMVFWDKIIPRLATKVIVDSLEIKKQLFHHGFSDHQTVVIYNGLKGNNAHYHPRKNKKTQVLFFARLEEIKGVKFIEESLQELPKSVWDILEIHFYGAGTLESRIKNLTTLYPAGVFFHGFYEGDFQSIFQQADIYMLPSLMEGLPYTVLEAMRAGCCILATDVGGLPEMIENGISGELIEPKNAKVLTQSLVKLINSKDLREKLGRAAKVSFEAKFEQSAIFKLHSSLFDISSL